MTRDMTGTALFYKICFSSALCLDLCPIPYYSFLPWLGSRGTFDISSPQALSKLAHLSSDLKTDRQNRGGEKIFLRLEIPGEY